MDSSKRNIQQRAHPCVMWFRYDLRLDDNPALLAAEQYSKGRVLPVFCLNPDDYKHNLLGWPKMGAYRARFLMQALTDLRSKLKRIGSDLIILRGRPQEVLVDLAEAHGVTYIFSQEPQSFEESRLVKRVQSQCVRQNIEYKEVEGSTLYHSDKIPFELDDLPTDFIRFRRVVEKEISPNAPELAIKKLLPLPLHITVGRMPKMEDFNSNEYQTDPRTTLPFIGGEAHALKRLKDYVWDQRLLGYYHRAHVAFAGEQISSKLSAWINLGCLSPRRLWYEALAFELKHGDSLGVYQLIYHLTMRDFFIFQSRKYGESFYSLEGIRNEKKASEENQDLFAMWWQGYTGFPLIDAFMRELASTGYITVQGRKIVSQFLVHELKLPWTWGAACFQTLLRDYNPAITYGSYQSIAGVGFKLPGRAEHHADIGQRLDRDGAYVRYWVPALGYLPSECIYEPYLLNEEAQNYYGVILNQDYPYPVIAPPERPAPVVNRDYQQILQERRERAQRKSTD
jgi:deoxyribodipyrimidine photo-lyase